MILKQTYGFTIVLKNLNRIINQTNEKFVHFSASTFLVPYLHYISKVVQKLKFTGAI